MSSLSSYSVSCISLKRQSLRTSKHVEVRKILVLTFCWCSVFFLIFQLVYYETTLMRTTSKSGVRQLLQQELSNSDLQELHNKKSIDSDSPPKLTTLQLIKLSSQASNLPLQFFSNPKKDVNSSCVKYPNVIDLDFNNIYWQKLTVGNVTFYLYGAYFDDRPKDPVVRVLAMVNIVTPPPTLCHMWYKEEDSVENRRDYSNVSYTYMWNNKWGNYKDGILQPFIITCPASVAVTRIPSSISIVEKCDGRIPTNNLRVVNNRPSRKQDFAVCVKGLDFLYEDISLRLIEWIELLNILGAKKIFMYELEVHPNISKVLNYYVKQGLVENTPITLPGSQPNLPGLRHLYLKHKIIHKRQNELMPYNDCLYKNLYSYEYVALLDTDEVIMPLKHNNWEGLMQEVMNISKQKYSDTKDSYNFRNAYFLDNFAHPEEEVRDIEEGIPRYLHMLQHVYRSENYTSAGFFVKCFHKVNQVVSLHNHFPLNCFGTCTTYSVNTSLAHMQHYRKDCVGSLKTECNDYKNHIVRDIAIWRYKDELIQRTSAVMTDLGLLKP